MKSNGIFGRKKREKRTINYFFCEFENEWDGGTEVLKIFDGTEVPEIAEKQKEKLEMRNFHIESEGMVVAHKFKIQNDKKMCQVKC